MTEERLQTLERSVNYQATAANEAVEELAAEVRRLRAALIDHGEHNGGCPAGREACECICGWDAVWDSLKVTEEDLGRRLIVMARTEGDGGMTKRKLPPLRPPLEETPEGRLWLAAIERERIAERYGQHIAKILREETYLAGVGMETVDDAAQIIYSLINQRG